MNPAHHIDSLRNEAAALLRAQAEDGWRSWAFGEDSHQAQLYAEHAGLFTRDNLHAVSTAVESGGGSSGETEALAMFRLYLEREWIGLRTAAQTDDISNRESAAEVAVDGQRVGFRGLTLLLANEPDSSRRDRIFRAADPVYDALNPLRADVEQTQAALTRELGYDGYNAFSERQRHLDLKSLTVLARGWLETSRPVYELLLDEALRRELNVDRGQFFRYDTTRLLRSPSTDRGFPAANLLPAMKETLAGLGIDLDRQPNIRLDTEARERKVPRAVMFAIDAPGDIRISIRPVGGLDDFAALFHEMGHAQHFAQTREKAWEFRNVGASNAVTECFAFLFEHLLDDPEWLRRYARLEGEALRAVRRSRAFRRMFMVRRYAAKLQYEAELHAASRQEPAAAAGHAAAYAGWLQQALLYRPHPSEPLRYLADVDDYFYSADYLRAWFLEAQLLDALRQRFGWQWFRTVAAGDYLRELWSSGQRYPAEAFLREAGLPALQPEALTAEIQSMLA